MSDGGKGSAPRPFCVGKEDFSKQWESIFGKEVRCDRCGKMLRIKPDDDGVHTCTPPAKGEEQTA